MTYLGTRQILQDELQKYELHHRARIAIKPGITGMWQVSGRSDITDFEEVVRLDEIVPFHQSLQKRYIAKVILKYHFVESDIVRITKSIVDDIKYSNVYKNAEQEQRLNGLPVNMIRCHMGYDEQDMVKCNFAWITIWVDDTMDKNNWYGNKKNSEIIDGIFVEKHISYNVLRMLNQQTVPQEEYIKQAKQYLNEIIGCASDDQKSCL